MNPGINFLITITVTFQSSKDSCMNKYQNDHCSLAVFPSLNDKMRERHVKYTSFIELRPYLNTIFEMKVIALNQQYNSVESIHHTRNDQLIFTRFSDHISYNRQNFI